MTSNYYISTDRVASSGGSSMDLLTCSICHNLLWKPVACKTCENSFCLSCMDQWLETSNGKTCPNQCQYEQRKCPPLMLQLLSKLKIKCQCQKNGCQHILGYEQLELHESTCDYQLKRCSGCQQNFLKRDHFQHEQQCGQIKVTCERCQTVYEREQTHDQIQCLNKRQDNMQKEINLLKLQNMANERTIQQLQTELSQVKSKQTTMNAPFQLSPQPAFFPRPHPPASFQRPLSSVFIPSPINHLQNRFSSH
ncbi:unnamed protein product [Didymodactylos carnosus]|uniref:RING-type domain-containing protein n=1 Tax=Didymodactylos carnosus TaxID=1234261 RepID=A0A815DX64_9BILA